MYSYLKCFCKYFDVKNKKKHIRNYEWVNQLCFNSNKIKYKICVNSF